MSHISKAQLQVNLERQDLLEKALLSLKNVEILKDANIYRMTSYTDYSKDSKIYDYVIVDKNNSFNRIGVKKENNSYSIHYDSFGPLGDWAIPIKQKLEDWYSAYLIAENIKEASNESYDDFEINIFEDENGAIQIEANEMEW